MVRDVALSGPIAFTRDLLDAGATAHPNIMTMGMRDGSDAIADWPLLDALAMCSSQADLVAIHSGGGFCGYMTSAGVTVIADGTRAAEERLRLSLTNDTSIGVMRCADAGYPEKLEEAERKEVACGISDCRDHPAAASPVAVAETHDRRRARWSPLTAPQGRQKAEAVDGRARFCRSGLGGAIISLRSRRAL